jgi:cellobiose phosphorylase
VTRRFRGTTYEIAVRNPEQVCKGMREMRVDGKQQQGNIVPLGADGARHHVEVVLG